MYTPASRVFAIYACAHSARESLTQYNVVGAVKVCNAMADWKCKSSAGILAV